MTMPDVTNISRRIAATTLVNQSFATLTGAIAIIESLDRIENDDCGKRRLELEDLKTARAYMIDHTRVLPQ